MGRAEGYVLVSVLWVVALLTVITLSYHHRARLEVQAARYSLDASQCRMAARGAVERGIVEIQNKITLDAIATAAAQAETPPMTYLGQPWARPQNLFAAGGLLDPGEGFEADEVRVAIEDLERYVNINTASVDLLENLPGFTRSVVRRINFQRTGTDEAGERTGDGPVSVQDPAELRYLRGIDEAAWFGEGDDAGLRDVLTTFGDGRVNINTASGAVLALLPGVGDNAVADILAYRNGEDGAEGTADDRGFGDWNVFETTTQISGDTLVSLKQHCKFDSDYFKITGTATRRSGIIRASCAAVVRIPNGSNTASVVSWTEESLGS